MSILFINGSPNKNGNTAAMAAKLLKGKTFLLHHILNRRWLGALGKGNYTPLRCKAAHAILHK